MPRKRGTSAAHLPPWGFRCLARRPTRTARVSAAGKGGDVAGNGGGPPSAGAVPPDGRTPPPRRMGGCNYSLEGSPRDGQRTPPLAGTLPPPRSARPPSEIGVAFSGRKAPFQAEKRPLESKSVELSGRTSSSRASGLMAEIGAQTPRGALVRHLGRSPLFILRRYHKLRQRLLHPMRQSCSDMQRRNGFTAFDTADHVAQDTALQPQRMHAQATGFTEFLQAARYAVTYRGCARRSRRRRGCPARLA